jgi:GDP-L-fucose synthase
MKILNKDTILVTGATGFLGSHIMLELKKKYNKNNIIGVSSKHFDLTSYTATEKMFLKYKPSIVIHLAAYSGGIGANTKYQADFFSINLKLMINIFDCSNKYKIKKLLYPMGGCSYPNVNSLSLKESDIWNGMPVETSLGYSMAKKMSIVASWCYKRQYNFNSSIVIPGNMYGEFDNFNLDNSHVISSLIRKFYEARLYNYKKIILWGTGNPIRDFIYVGDVAACMINFLEKDISYPVNISYGKGYSIKKIANIIKKVSGFSGKVIWDITSPDGQNKRIMNVNKMIELGYKPCTDIKSGIIKTYNWFKENYNNKATIRL